ncbi:unnamed protein product [Auanema sp. JU1783]|nr:unnamed protein product [Auanema sp. JU1783]
MGSLAEWFWNDQNWLPAGVKWHDIKSNATITYPQIHELRYTLYGGFLLLILRVMVESFVFVPIGYLGGWIANPCTRIVEHVRGGFMGNSKFKRVAECGWRLCFYVFAFTLGFYVLYDTPQFQDVKECWRDWPYHHLPGSVWWYYIIEASFYWSLFYGTLFFDVRRGDFYQMMLHHAVTIVLLYISWSMNMVRIGTLILFSHDAADIFIEGTKIVRYAGWKMIVNCSFVIFLFVWISTRLVYYPFWVLWSVWFDAPSLIQTDYEWSNISQSPHVPRLLMVMLSTLLVLHIYWTYLILLVAYRSTKGAGVDDVREDDSDSEDDDNKKEN